uniref:hypothetical protein n=1 Tax=Bacteroides nordii TaxID=291645 RepID=UPI00189D2B80
FRTEKLSLITPMVLRNSGRVGSRRFLNPPFVKMIDGRGILLLVVFTTEFHRGISRILIYPVYEE